MLKVTELQAAEDMCHLQMAPALLCLSVPTTPARIIFHFRLLLMMSYVRTVVMLTTGTVLHGLLFL